TRPPELVSALRQFLGGAEDAARLQAYEVARDAMAIGVGLLEIVADHQQALGIVLAESSTMPDCRRATTASAQLLQESLGSFEMAQRGYQEVNAALLRFNQELERKVRERTVELQDSLDRLRTSDELRRRLLAQLVTSQEEERRRIAADIHDDSIQVMTAAAMRLHTIRSAAAGGDHNDRLAQIERGIEQAITRLRGLMFGLRPP